MSQPPPAESNPDTDAPLELTIEAAAEPAAVPAVTPPIVVPAEYRLAGLPTRSPASLDRLPPVAPLETAPPGLASHPVPTAIETVDKPRRLAALDVFRGITIAFMVLVNNDAGTPYAPLDHASWNGWTPTDLVFPFFLFIVGVATPFSLAKRSDAFTPRRALIGRIWVRALSLILLSHLLSAAYMPLPWHDAPASGFLFTKAFRLVGFVGVWASILALLIPWPWRRLSTWLPVTIAVLFWGYCVAMHFVRAHAKQHGWPVDDAGETLFGGGAFNPDKVRIPGVLARIGICYGVAATIALFAGWRSILVIIVALFAIYSTIMLKVRLRDHETGSLSMTDNVARRVDVAVFERHVIIDGKDVATQKHTWRDYPDNEGLLSTIPAIATPLIGVLVGTWLRTRRTASEHGIALLAMGVPMTFLGIVLDHALMPINKILWTPSFVVFTAGMAMFGLGFVFWMTDVLGRRVWAWPFKVMGMNAIAAFAASSIVTNLARFVHVREVPAIRAGGEVVRKAAKDVNVVTFAQYHVFGAVCVASDWLHAHAHLTPFATTQNLSLAWALTFVCVIFLITLVLYACRIFVKV